VIVAAAIVAGGLGGLLRAEIGDLVVTRLRRGAPLATFVVNVLGAFALGVVVSRLDVDGRAILGTGFTGGFTTYSAFALEPIEQWQHGMRGAAIANVAATVVVGTLAAALGLVVAGGWR
jgi:CrcB protein